MRHLLHALRLARTELVRALDWPDWEQRRVLLEAGRLFDSLAGDPEYSKSAEVAYYLVSDLLYDLNELPESTAPEPTR